MAFCTRVAQLMLLNLIFVVTCIPIVTIGAAVTALLGMGHRLLEDRDGMLVSTYFRLFRENFRRSTVLWLILLVTGALLAEYIYLAFFSRMTLTVVGIPLALLMMPAAIFLTIAWLMILVWVFVLQGHFENTVRRTISNALVLGVIQLPRTVVKVIILGVCILVPITLPVTLFFWILLGFSFGAYLCAAIDSRVIKKLSQTP